MDIDLKRCPFCGGKAKMMSREERLVGETESGDKCVVTVFYARCNKCFSRGKPFRMKTNKYYDPKKKTGEAKAAESWNARVESAGEKQTNRT